jgi:hypothetical protein
MKMKDRAKEVIKKTSSVWDWKGKPSIMLKDETLRRSQSATKGRAMYDAIPAQMQIYKDKK